jgi:D-amino-acid oxidase
MAIRPAAAAELPTELATLGDGIQPCVPASLPAGFAAGWRYTAPVVSMPVYLDYLLGRFRQAGGELRIGHVASLAAAAAGPGAPVLVNCAGIGAHDLVPVPHDGRVVLGGTEVAGDWTAAPDPGTAGRILRDCAAVDPRLATARIIEHRVGFRPARSRVRLEAEDTVATDGSSRRLLVHNYGHGGAGVTLSWGCARAVASLVAQLG